MDIREGILKEANEKIHQRREEVLAECIRNYLKAIDFDFDDEIEFNKIQQRGSVVEYPSSTIFFMDDVPLVEFYMTTYSWIDPQSQSGTMNLTYKILDLPSKI